MAAEEELIATVSDSLLSQSSAQPFNFPSFDARVAAWLDIKQGFLDWRIWFILAYQDIKLKYRRSILGPFWLTISMAITVYSMGYLYSHLFHTPLTQYYPFLVAGMLSWALISTIVTELTDSFTVCDGLIKQIKLPYSLYIHRIVCRNFIIFFHNILVIIPVLFFCHEYAHVNWHTLLMIPGLALFYINALIYGIILAMIGARYRDISQIIKSIVQVVFFITPIMWGPEALGGSHIYVIDYNPFYAFIELIRAPLLGNVPTIKNLMMVLSVSCLGFIICYNLFTRYRSRIIYWL